MQNRQKFVLHVRNTVLEISLKYLLKKNIKETEKKAEILNEKIPKKKPRLWNFLLFCFLVRVRSEKKKNENVISYIRISPGFDFKNCFRTLPNQASLVFVRLCFNSFMELLFFLMQWFLREVNCFSHLTRGLKLYFDCPAKV